MKKWHLESIVSYIDDPQEKLDVPDWRAMEGRNHKRKLTFRKEPRYLSSLRNWVGFLQRHF